MLSIVFIASLATVLLGWWRGSSQKSVAPKPALSLPAPKQLLAPKPVAARQPPAVAVAKPAPPAPVSSAAVERLRLALAQWPLLSTPASAPVAAPVVVRRPAPPPRPTPPERKASRPTVPRPPQRKLLVHLPPPMAHKAPASVETPHAARPERPESAPSPVQWTNPSALRPSSSAAADAHYPRLVAVSTDAAWVQVSQAKTVIVPKGAPFEPWGTFLGPTASGGRFNGKVIPLH